MKKKKEKKKRKNEAEEKTTRTEEKKKKKTPRTTNCIVCALREGKRREREKTLFRSTIGRRTRFYGC